MEKHKPNGRKRLGLVGKDINYSFSKGYFAKKFEEENITAYSYENFDLESIDLFPSLLQDSSIMGLNVTIPYKELILPYLDDVQGDAANIGAVNTIRFDQNRRAIGFNTDTFGFEKALLEMVSQIPKNALILGTGGASKAVAYVLSKNNISYSYVSRSPGTENISYDALDEIKIATTSLIINCTPLGTFPNVGGAPDIPYEGINNKHLLFDLVYNPPKSKFLKLGEQKGAQIQNGLAMLHYQAERSWEIWHRQE
tara:strand:- start:475 stop:1236 length:762 start_codon:yes stop_codon:yes gene_type:complete